MQRPLRLRGIDPLPGVALWIPLADIGGPSSAVELQLEHVASRDVRAPLPVTESVAADLRDELSVALVRVTGTTLSPLYQATFGEAEPAWNEHARERGSLILFAGPSWTAFPSLQEALLAQWAAVVPLALFAFPDGVGTTSG